MPGGRRRRLLSHTSGVGEYLDDDADEYLMPASMHTYTSPEDLMPLFDVPMLSTPGEAFVYSNAGFVLLGLVAQRASPTTTLTVLTALASGFRSRGSGSWSGPTRACRWSASTTRAGT